MLIPPPQNSTRAAEEVGEGIGRLHLRLHLLLLLDWLLLDHSLSVTRTPMSVLRCKSEEMEWTGGGAGRRWDHDCTYFATFVVVHSSLSHAMPSHGGAAVVVGG